MPQPIVIGVTGGSGSGKTSVSKQIIKNFSGLSVMLLQQDSYYKDQSSITFEERLNTNYDHPLAFDNDLFIEHLKKLINGDGIVICARSFALEKIEKLEQILDNVKN